MPFLRCHYSPDALAWHIPSLMIHRSRNANACDGAPENHLSFGKGHRSLINHQQRIQCSEIACRAPLQADESEAARVCFSISDTQLEALKITGPKGLIVPGY